MTTVINGGTLGRSAMSQIAVKSSAARTRIRRAEASLEGRNPDEELLLIGATLDAANELARTQGCATTCRATTPVTF